MWLSSYYCMRHSRLTNCGFLRSNQLVAAYLGLNTNSTTLAANIIPVLTLMSISNGDHIPRQKRTGRSFHASDRS